MSFEINLTIVPETDLSMQILHGDKKKSKQHTEKGDKSGEKRPRKKGLGAVHYSDIKQQ